MQVYCGKCKKRQEKDEKHCKNCGEPYGGETWVLMLGATIITLLATMFIFSGNKNALLDPRLIFWFLLPVMVGVGVLYDYHPKRRGIYFYCGGAIIVIGVLFCCK